MNFSIILNRNIVVIFLMHTTILLMSQNNEDYKVLFNETVNDICIFSHYNGEFNGIESQVICNNVYDLVYNVDTSEISVSQKLDLINLLLYFQRYTYRSYRSRVKDNFLNNKKESNRENLIYIIPLAFCDNCNFEIISKLNEYFELEGLIESVPVDYVNYYTQLIDLIIKESTDDIKDFTPSSYTNILFQIEILQTNKFQIKYPCFKNIIESKY